MSSQTGSEVLAYCGACKMDLAAVVVAKVGSKIAKVQCKTCKKEHSFRDPKGSASNAAPKKTRSSKASGAVAAGPARTSIESEWNKVMRDAAQARRVKYSIQAQLAQGDVVQHPSFGDGVVMKVAHPDKAEIMFRDDIRLLIHSRK